MGEQREKHEAFVTLATSNVYALGCLVLGNSLRRVGTTRQLVVMITEGVSSSLRHQLAQVFHHTVVVNVLDSGDICNLYLLGRPDLSVTFTKFHCWRLTQFKKCVFMDADTLVIQNIDELFDREELSAAPDPGWPDCFNSGVFVYVPSEETYRNLLSFAVTSGSFDGGDQGLLNLYFKGWATEDIGKHLPFIYNVVSQAFYSYLPAFKQFYKHIKVVHFIGAVKPWNHSFNPVSRKVTQLPNTGHSQEFLQLWWDIFMECVQPNLDPELGSIVGELANITVSQEASALKDARERRLRWEQGQADYMGVDSFSNIKARLDENIAPPTPSASKTAVDKDEAAKPKVSPAAADGVVAAGAGSGSSAAPPVVDDVLLLGEEGQSLAGPSASSFQSDGGIPQSQESTAGIHDSEELRSSLSVSSHQSDEEIQHLITPSVQTAPQEVTSLPSFESQAAETVSSSPRAAVVSQIEDFPHALKHEESGEQGLVETSALSPLVMQAESPASSSLAQESPGTEPPPTVSIAQQSPASGPLKQKQEQTPQSTATLDSVSLPSTEASLGKPSASLPSPIVTAPTQASYSVSKTGPEQASATPGTDVSFITQATPKSNVTEPTTKSPITAIARKSAKAPTKQASPQTQVAETALKTPITQASPKTSDVPQPTPKISIPDQAPTSPPISTAPVTQSSTLSLSTESRLDPAFKQGSPASGPTNSAREAEAAPQLTEAAPQPTEAAPQPTEAETPASAPPKSLPLSSSSAPKSSFVTSQASRFQKPSPTSPSSATAKPTSLLSQMASRFESPGAPKSQPFGAGARSPPGSEPPRAPASKAAGGSSPSDSGGGVASRFGARFPPPKK